MRVTVIIATSGQAGQTAGLATTPEELGRVREQEARDAGLFLGVSEVYLLGYTDGKLDQADETEVEEKVVRLMREERPDVVITFGPEGAGNEHRDHKAISRIATAATRSAADTESFIEQLRAGLSPHQVKKFYYMSGSPVPWREMTEPFLPITTVINISELVELKMEAFKLHRSQQQWTARLEEWISCNKNTEPYHRAFSVVSELPDPETDLFAGLDLKN